MTNKEALHKNKKAVAALYRKVIKLKVQQWDLIGQIEDIVGEIDGESEDTEMWAVNCGRAGEAEEIGIDELITSLEKMLCDPDGENDDEE